MSRFSIDFAAFGCTKYNFDWCFSIKGSVDSDSGYWVEDSNGEPHMVQFDEWTVFPCEEDGKLYIHTPDSYCLVSKTRTNAGFKRLIKLLKMGDVYEPLDTKNKTILNMFQQFKTLTSASVKKAKRKLLINFGRMNWRSVKVLSTGILNINFLSSILTN